MARKSKGLHLRPLIAVYGKGASEVAYFKMCQRKQHAANVKTEKLKVESLNRGGVALLQAARAKRDRLVGTKRVEQTYVVFDRDAMTAAELQQCEQYAKQHDLKLVFSSTNFDVWILMHFEPMMRAYTTLTLNRKLSGAGYFARDYAQFKDGDYADYHLDDVINQAMTHAAQLRRAHEDEWYQRDPYTNMDTRLVEIFGTDEW